MDPAKWKLIKNDLAAALELSGAERFRYVEGLDDSIRPDVERLLEADSSAADFIEEPAIFGRAEITHETDCTPDQIDGYRLLKTLGSGGMGTVYLAERSDRGFNRQVALKIIKRGMDTNSILKRFLMERQILADLEHPNIARMLDGGSTEDGLPYFVMEYVDGLELRRFCNENGYGLSQRLELFKKICGAVSEAHRNLVVHRDLKPTNILVTKDGEPKLLDFGIAKLLLPDWNADTNEATLTQFRVMTPEYASPEQLAGKATSTSTDVYSLGVILYELLTGERPFKTQGKAPQELIDSILSKEPQRPSVAAFTRNAQAGDETRVDTARRTDEQAGLPVPSAALVDSELLQGDLDNVVLKALHSETERRYRSVEEFAEDIRRYQAGLPVTATADSRTYRFAKFFKRHRAGVLAVAAATVFLIGATGITGWQYSVAQKERAKAERRFNDVRRLANTILFDHYDRIKELPGATEARAKLVSDALQYLDSLVLDEENDLELLREVADAYKRLAEVQNQNMAGGNLGDAEASKENYLKAHTIRERIVLLSKGDPTDKAALARSFGTISYLYEDDREKMREYSRRSLDIYRELLEVFPDRAKIRADYSTALWDWANVVRLDEGNRAAISVFEESVAVREELMSEDPDNKGHVANASLTYKNLGTLLSLEQDHQGSLKYYRRSFEMDERLLSAEPDNTRLRLALTFSRKGLGDAYLNLGEAEKAIEEYEKAIAIQQRIIDMDPANNFAANALVRSLGHIAVAYQKAGRFHDADVFFRRAIARLDGLRSGAAQDKLQKAVLLLNYGRFLLDRPETKVRGFEELRKAESIFAEVKNANAFDPAFQEQYDETLKLLGG
ncbi:MAG: protein kinase [Acidobacteria bacterium]|nr:protein kinase [Acidobacteriota bacterium]